MSEQGFVVRNVSFEELGDGSGMRRVKACIEACGEARIPTEALEAGMVKELVALLDRYTYQDERNDLDHTALHQDAMAVLAKVKPYG